MSINTNIVIIEQHFHMYNLYWTYTANISYPIANSDEVYANRRREKEHTLAAWRGSPRDARPSQFNSRLLSKSHSPLTAKAVCSSHLVHLTLMSPLRDSTLKPSVFHEIKAT